jgi:hypothetical protein
MNRCWRINKWHSDSFFRIKANPCPSTQPKSNGSKAHIEFVHVDREANLRLHSFVWDKMIERIQFLQQQRSGSS